MPPHGKKSAIYVFEGFRLDVARRLLYDPDERQIALKPKALDTLVYLIERAGMVVERDDLLSSVWSDIIVEENNLTQHISSLRRIFKEKPDDHRFIATIPGHGYKFVARVTIEGDSEPQPPRPDLFSRKRLLILTVGIGSIFLILGLFYRDEISLSEIPSASNAASDGPSILGRRAEENRSLLSQSSPAYQLFLEGKLHSQSLDRKELQQAIKLFNEAVTIDPSLASACVELANAYRSMILSNDVPPNEMMTNARFAAKKAVEVDGSLPEARAALAICSFWFDWNWGEAEQNFKLALALAPENSKIHAAYAHLLSNVGRNEEAVREIERARDIDPLDRYIGSIEGQILSFAGRDDQSTTKLQAVILTYPDFWLAHLFISRNYIKHGRWNDAIAEATKAKEKPGGSSEAMAVIAYAYAKSGRLSEARRMLAELDERARSGLYVPSYVLAEVYLAMGERGRALELLEKAFAQGEPLMVFLKVEPRWNELRDEPRFKNLLKRMKL